MTLLKSKRFPLLGFIFPQLQLQAPKGILPSVKGSKKENITDTGLSIIACQIKPAFSYQNQPSGFRSLARFGHSDFSIAGVRGK